MNRMIVYTIAAVSIILLSTMCNKNQKDSNTEKKTDATTEATMAREMVFDSSQNLVSKAKEWVPAHDEFGSSYDTSKLILSDSLKKIHYTLIKKTEGDKWPYIELICVIGGNLNGKMAMKLSYSCSKPLIIKLSQSDFNNKGNETYSHYQYTVPASDSLNTVMLLLSEFKQPEWTPEESKTIPLKLENVDAVYFTPEIDAEVGGEADLAISEFYLL